MSRSLVAVLVLAATSSIACKERSTPAWVPLESPDRDVVIDPDGVRHACVPGTPRTNRGHGIARVCGGRPVLSGEVVQGDSPEFPRMPGERVTVRTLDGVTVADVKTDAHGLFALFVPAGVTVFVETSRPGWITELHAVTVPATGWDLPLDLRRPEAFRLDPALGPVQSDERGMLMAEFLGASNVVGVGLTVAPAGNPAIMFGADGKPVVSPRLAPGAREILVFMNLPPGTVRVTPLDGPAARCRPQARGLEAWPISPGVLTQLDLECESFTP